MSTSSTAEILVEQDTDFNLREAIGQAAIRPNLSLVPSLEEQPMEIVAAYTGRIVVDADPVMTVEECRELQASTGLGLVA